MNPKKPACHQICKVGEMNQRKGTAAGPWQRKCMSEGSGRGMPSLDLRPLTDVSPWHVVGCAEGQFQASTVKVVKTEKIVCKGILATVVDPVLCLQYSLLRMLRQCFPSQPWPSRHCVLSV